MTKGGITANIRALRHFIELRGAEDNVLEIRMVALQVARLMRAEAPAAFEDYEEFTGADGFVAVRNARGTVKV